MKEIKPILFIVFNRPEITRRSFEILRRLKVPKLYISQDGPRENHKGDIKNCPEVKEIVANVDWNCDVHYNFHEENQGCRRGVLSAIDWFFSKENEGIILEDDILPHDGFFEFCSFCLSNHRDDNDVLAIQGFNQFGQRIKSDEYFGARGFYPWGWATWKSRWEKYNAEIEYSRIKYGNSNFPKVMRRAISFNLQLIEKDLLDTWDMQFVAMQVDLDGYVITPYANLTTNIGVDGAHSSNNRKILGFELGEFNPLNLVKAEFPYDDEEMNNLLKKEYIAFSHKIILKTLLLRMGLYSLTRKLIKGLR